jgi:hypothetical protein
MPNVPRRDSAPPATPSVPAGPTCSAPRFFAYWLLALGAAVAAFASHIYIRHRVVELGYALGQERSHRARMENERRDLELELAAMEAPGDLAQVSRDVLGLDVPRDDQLLAVDAAATAPASEAVATPAVIVGPAAAGPPAEPVPEPLPEPAAEPTPPPAAPAAAPRRRPRPAAVAPVAPPLLADAPVAPADQEAAGLPPGEEAVP